MPLSEKEILKIKLTTINLPILKEIVKNKGQRLNNSSDIIKYLINLPISNTELNQVIKSEYNKKIESRKNLISDEDLLKELNKVKNFNWSVVQGALDNKIQSNYVRKFFKLNDLIKNIENKLYQDIKNYTICSWYNHWSTVIIEDLISTHPKVIPTIKNKKGIDIFFKEYPFDLKITYLPEYFRDKNIKKIIDNPNELIIWLYENQGALRFGDDNRLYIILYDTKSPEESWKLKKDIKLINDKITYFFDNETISENDEIVFNYKNKTYTAISKVLFIFK